MAIRAQLRHSGAAAAGEGALERQQAPEPDVAPEERRRPRLAIPHPRRHDHSDEPSVVIARELARSRRYGHPVALIGIVPVHGAPRSPSEAAASIRRRVRAVDSVWASSAGIFVLLPESDRADADALLERLRREATETLEGAVTHVAAFPAGALTADALTDIARGRIAPPVLDRPAADGPGREPAVAAPLASAEPEGS